MIISVYQEMKPAHSRGWWLIGVRRTWSEVPSIVAKVTDEAEAYALADEIREAGIGSDLMDTYPATLDPEAVCLWCEARRHKASV